MRLDIITIFPEYFAPLDLSLIGQARAQHLLDVRLTNLRDHTLDRHHRVDDSPFGGGAGMVMTPQPWAAALSAVIDQPPATADVPHLIIPDPSGTAFTQSLAREFAAQPWLAFACGRYEGIDERVYEHAASRMPVSVISIGDYVLNGGEVAALAMIEAIARLVPGVVGNSDSLIEESHEDGLLEYPVYTRPARWDDDGVIREVPPVLLSGHHSDIAAWRQQQRIERTARRRPDLLHPAGVTGDLLVSVATPADAGEILLLRSLTQTDWELAEVASELVRSERTTWIARADHRAVGTVRAAAAGSEGGTAREWIIDQLAVAPDVQRRGIGSALLARAEAAAPVAATHAVLTCHLAAFARHHGYRRDRQGRQVKALHAD